jgi:hypothetical protein
VVAHQEDVRELGLEPHLAPTLNDLLADGRDDGRKTVGADVRMSIYQNIGIGPKLHEGAENAVYIAPLSAAGIEFSVRVGARSALSETVVALWVDDMLAVDGRKVAPAGTDVLATFQDYGANAEFYQPERGKQPRWPGPDDHGMMLRLRYILKMARLIIGMLLRDGLALHKHRDLQVETNVAVARVYASSQLLETCQLIGSNARCRSHAMVQLHGVGIFEMRDGELDLAHLSYSK